MNSSVPLWLRRLAIAGVFIWMTTITILSSMTPEQIEGIEPFSIWDKAAHFIAFALGAGNLALALRWNTRWSSKKVILFTTIGISLFGVLDEYHQLYTPGRSGGDPRDWTADTLGGLIGSSVAALIYARFERTHRPAPART